MYKIQTVCQFKNFDRKKILIIINEYFILDLLQTMKTKNYYPESYKDDSNPYPAESWRKLRKGNQTQNKPELLVDENWDVFYSEINKKEEIKNAFSDETAYDREKELIEAIDSDKEETDEIPDRVKTAETHNEIKERFDSEENEKYKKYDKYKNFDVFENKGSEETTEEEIINEQIDKSIIQNESENQNTYYERKISKTKSNDGRNIDYKQKNFHPNKHPDKDRRHGREKHWDFKKSNRADRHYTKMELKEVLR